jgi:regulatory protein
MTHTKTRTRIPARQVALAMMARRMLSQAELRERLIRKGFSTSEVEDALDLVCSYKYLDDAAVAESVARKAERSGRGPGWAQQTLARRGVPESLWQPVLEPLAAHQATVALRAVQQRFGEPQELERSARNRAYRWLLGRGFSNDCVADILGEI